MGRVIYSENKVTEFIEAAKEKGIGPAMRELNYPASWTTAQRWFDERNEPLPTIDSLASKAKQLAIFYSDKEKLFGAQALIDRIVQSLQEDDLDADALNKLANAYNKAIQTFNLIEGKSTSITESRTKDATDLAVMDLINAQKAKNALIESELG